MPYLYVFFLVILLAASPVMANPAVPYTVSITGVKNKALLKALQDSSDSIALAKKPPTTLALLALRVRTDARRFRQLLDSFGYYAANVKPAIDEETQPAKVSFAVQLGKPFVFSSVTITSSTPIPSLSFPSLEQLGLTPGTIAEAKTVVSAQDAILRHINEQGYPYATVNSPTVVVDHATHNMNVAFTVSPGPIAYFGATNIAGFTSVDPDFIRKKIPWEEGALYTPALIEKYEKILNDSALFSIATVTKSSALDPGNQLPITVTLKERPHRTIKTGVNYQTDDGPGVKLLWQHRNLFHHGEQLDIGGSVSGVKRTLNNRLTFGNFLRKDQSLKLFFTLDNEDTDAYFSNNLSIGTTIERKITTPLTLGIGTNYKLSHIKRTEENDNFGLISFPLYANYDSRNNALDPSSGNNSSLQFTPSFNTLAGSSSFTKEYASTTHYMAFSTLPKLVLAGRAALGLIQSPSTGSVPLDERFYAGGSGSVRGYGYQSLGPTEDGTPTGGRSLIEMSGEVRYKLSPKIGLVAFLDGGNSYSTPVPDVSEGIYLGTGAGIRYYTEIAPIRFDIGVPLDNDKASGSPIQFYISLGQAF